MVSVIGAVKILAMPKFVKRSPWCRPNAVQIVVLKCECLRLLSRLGLLSPRHSYISDKKRPTFEGIVGLVFVFVFIKLGNLSREQSADELFET